MPRYNVALICVSLVLAFTHITAAFLNLNIGGGKGKKNHTHHDPWDGHDHSKEFNKSEAPTMPPMKPQMQHKVKYLLRDRKGQSWKEMAKDGSVPSGVWHEEGDLKMLFHGYTSKGDIEDPMKIFKHQNINDIGLQYAKDNSFLNIIIVDWTSYSGGLSTPYETMVSNVPNVADEVSEFILNLLKEENLLGLDRLHMIGFCSGAHLAGIVGLMLFEKKEAKVARITGLDPSGQGWDDDTEGGKKYKDERLSITKEDAAFVDIIHCNMGQAGSRVQAGHADFYPNGGETQKKDCTPIEDTPEISCSHRLCPLYFAKSTKTDYLACLCDDYDDFEKGSCECTAEDGGVLMGDRVSISAAGRYYLSATAKKAH